MSSELDPLVKLSEQQSMAEMIKVQKQMQTRINMMDARILLTLNKLEQIASIILGVDDDSSDLPSN